MFGRWMSLQNSRFFIENWEAQKNEKSAAGLPLSLPYFA